MWIIWHLLIFLDALWNWWKIKKAIHIYHGLESLYRAVAAIVLGWTFGVQHHDWKGWMCYILGTFFSFWFWFNPTLNSMRGMPLETLGNNILDKIEAKIPPIASFVWKAILAAAFIYAYFHTDLL